MAIHNPPQYRYSLFDDWDKWAFEFIKQIAKNKDYPEILGTPEDKNQFLITLIRTQKALHNWRALLEDTVEEIKLNNSIDTPVLNKKYPPKNIGKDVPGWVTYEEDKIVSNFIDKLADRKVIFVGTDQEMAEFILRFILGQLGHDWEQTIMMIWEMLGENNKLEVKKLNDEMKSFDYLKLFDI